MFSLAQVLAHNKMKVKAQSHILLVRPPLKLNNNNGKALLHQAKSREFILNLVQVNLIRVGRVEIYKIVIRF